MSKNVTKKTSTNKKVETPKKEVKKEAIKEEKVETKKEEVKEKKVEKKPVVKEEKETKKEKKKCNKVIIIAICAVVVIAIGIVLKFINSDEKKITNSIKTMGESFYTEYYYPSLSKDRDKKELEKILSNFKDKGIKINLKNLAIYNNGKYKKEIDSFKNKDKKCNQTGTKVIIYPNSPYGKNDYKIDVELDCGF